MSADSDPNNIQHIDHCLLLYLILLTHRYVGVLPSSAELTYRHVGVRVTVSNLETKPDETAIVSILTSVYFFLHSQGLGAYLNLPI